MAASMKLDYLIVHLMDHKKEIETLSNQLTGFDEEAGEALYLQIDENKGDDYSQPFVFDDERNMLVRNACDAILRSPGDRTQFIASTRTIAHHLYTVILGNHSIKIGQLLFALFREDAGDPWLAIMKMQPAGDTYILEPLPPTTEGDVAFKLQLRSGAILGGLLQKCAFIAPASRRTYDNHLIVRDHQALSQEGDLRAARFFIDQFLGCKITISNREMTRHAVGVLRTAAREHRNEWGREVVSAVIERIDSLQHGSRFDIVETISELIPESDQTAIRDALKAKRVTAPVITIELAPGRVREQEPEYVWLEGDNGLLMRLEREAYEAGDILARIDPERGQQRYSIRTTALVEVPPPFGNRLAGTGAKERVVT